MVVLIIIMGLWVGIGVHTWLSYPGNDFTKTDFFLGLPMCVIFWPMRVIKRLRE